MYYMCYRVGTTYQESYNIIYSDYLHILDFCYCGDYYKTQKLEIVYKLCNEQSIEGENPFGCLLHNPFAWKVLLFTWVLFALMVI